MTDTQTSTTKAAEHYTALAAQIKAERADMLLRANAGDLLEALETLEAALIRDMGAGYAGVALCQAAIAKAKGEQV